MRLTIAILISATGLFAQQMQMPGMMPGGAPRGYTPTYDDVKATLGLTDEQLTQLKQLQQDKAAATTAFFSKQNEKQKELQGLMEANSTDAAHIGTLMIELTQLRKQPAPTGGDIHEKAVALLTPEQKAKLEKLEEAQKLRSSVDQSVQLGLLNPPPPPQKPAMPGMQPVKPETLKK